MHRHVLIHDESTCRRRTSIKWQHYDPDVLPLWVAEMDVLPAPPIADEIRRVVADGDLGYPVAGPYLEAVARWYARWSTPTDPSRMALVTDAMSGVKGAIIAMTDPGDPVYITVPVYPPFHSVVAGNGRQRVPVALTADGRLDVPALEAAFASAPGRGAVLLSNPHNPTGTVPTVEELTDLARAAERYGVAIISDEVHAPLVLPGAQFTPVLSIPQAAGALSVISPAKGWNLAGLKAAAVVGGPGASAAIGRVPADLAYTASHVAVRAHIAAMDEGQGWLADLVSDLAANRSLLGGLMAHHLPDVRWRPGQATYLAWLDCRPLGLGDDPADHFVRHGRVALNSGLPFGAGRGHARLNFAASPEVLVEAVRRMGHGLDQRTAR
ncbi:MalY/PatB family protein [Janibacter alittae]|uniref:cysteine-S-conjugate beta-lyase n=1 Tax=Janibacter alittae TaxID=3115209 RepID=A0ABZ2MLT4_9MICO